MTRTPAALASSGRISGLGLAMANTMASGAMVTAISRVSAPATEVPMNTSAPLMASASVPDSFSSLVISASHSLWSASPAGRPGTRMPCSSTAMMCLAPAVCSILMMAVPAAPGPFWTILTSSIRLPTTLRAFSTPANTMMAVPCWSSWNTGISRSRSSSASISKHSGLRISSRLMPPKVGAMALTAAMTSSFVLAFRQMGNASTPPNSLNSTHLPSMTGRPASGPMLPSPRTAVPLVTTATVRPFMV